MLLLAPKWQVAGKPVWPTHAAIAVLSGKDVVARLKATLPQLCLPDS